VTVSSGTSLTTVDSGSTTTVVTSTTTTSYTGEPFPTPTTSPLAIVFVPQNDPGSFYGVLLNTDTGLYYQGDNSNFEGVRYIFIDPNGFLFDADAGTYFNVGGGDFNTGGQLLRQSDGSPEKPASPHFGFGDGKYIYYDPNGVQQITCVRNGDMVVTFREPDANFDDCVIGDLEGYIFG